MSFGVVVGNVSYVIFFYYKCKVREMLYGFLANMAGGGRDKFSTRISQHRPIPAMKTTKVRLTLISGHWRSFKIEFSFCLCWLSDSIQFCWKQSLILMEKPFTNIFVWEGVMKNQTGVTSSDQHHCFVLWYLEKDSLGPLVTGGQYMISMKLHYVEINPWKMSPSYGITGKRWKQESKSPDFRLKIPQLTLVSMEVSH